MINIIFIQVSNSSLVNFSSLYQLAFLVPFLILLILGIKRKYDMARWLAILLVSAFFMLIGTRLSTFSQTEWSELLRYGIWPEAHAKFALGGLFFALVGIYITKRALNFNMPVLSIFAWVAPIGLAIQKVGCLIAGCCYGISTTLPWGILYHKNGIYLATHEHLGIIHPTQLYQLLIYLAISSAVLVFMKRFRRRESVISFAFLLLCGSRFLLEFLIDPQATNVGGSFFMGMKVLQWLLIAGFILSLIILYISENKKIITKTRRPVQSGLFQPITIFVLVTAGFILLHNAFSWTEIIAFNLRFTIISVLFGVILLKEISVPRLRWLTPVIFILPILMCSQTLPLQFEKERVYSGSFSAGKYFNQLRYNPHTAIGCDGNTYTAYDRVTFENSYFLGSVGYGIKARNGFQNYSYGGYLTTGAVSERRLDISTQGTIPFIALNPYAEYNWRWLGIGANVNLGYFPYLSVSESNMSTNLPDNNHRIFPILPGFSLRAGPYDIFDIRVRFASGFPTSLPSHIWEYSIGTGFGMKNGSGIRFGSTFPMEESLYFEGNLSLTKYDFFLRYIHRDNYFETTNDKDNNEFRIGLSYRLPVK